MSRYTSSSSKTTPPTPRSPSATSRRSPWPAASATSPTDRPRSIVSPRAPPDLVLLDLRLPKVDGIEVLRRVKADPRLRSIPVIVLTTSDAPDDLDAAYAAGASSYLVKPVDFAGLLRLMESFGRYWLECNRTPNAHA